MGVQVPPRTHLGTWLCRFGLDVTVRRFWLVGQPYFELHPLAGRLGCVPGVVDKSLAMRKAFVRYSSYRAAMSEEHRGGFPEPPAVGDEASTLVGSLERQRATFEWKCADLVGDELSMRLDSSELSVGRLLKHLAYMEDLNFTRDLACVELPAPWAEVDAATRSEWVFTSADLDPPETLYRMWREAVHRSRAAVTQALERGGPGRTYRDGNGQEATVRRLLVDMIEEYARHTGQADLIREAIDGRVGEDPPGPAVTFTLT